MRTIASNDHYVIEVDTFKNRIIFTMRGPWLDPRAVPNWLDDIDAALGLLSEGCTALIDWRSIGSILLTDYVRKAQDLMMKAGLRKAARLYASERFAKAQLDGLSRKTGFPVKWFLDREAAEAWLNED